MFAGFAYLAYPTRQKGLMTIIYNQNNDKNRSKFTCTAQKHS